MTTPNQVIPTDVPADLPLEFGDIVNLKPNTQPEQEFEKKADQLSVPLTVTLNLDPELKSRLTRVADDSNKTEQEYVETLLTTHLAKAIGQAVISSPSWGKRKISAPTNAAHMEAHTRRMK